jgi:hypothetical protein
LWRRARVGRHELLGVRWLAVAAARGHGGLNIEGLAWDASRHALLLGLRTPLHLTRPIVVPIRVEDLAGPWDTSNLELLPSIYLDLEGAVGDQGIRDLQYDPTRRAFLVLVGNDTSLSTSPFRLYVWGEIPREPRTPCRASGSHPR